MDKTKPLIEKAERKVREYLIAMDAGPATIALRETYVRDYGNIAVAYGEGALPDGSQLAVARVEEFSGDGYFI